MMYILIAYLYSGDGISSPFTGITNKVPLTEGECQTTKLQLEQARDKLNTKSQIRYECAPIGIK